MWLIIGDLHLTDNARDEYRFGIFNWIKRQQEIRPVAATFLAGDITDQKDRHSATLVNKIVDGLTSLKSPIYIDKGNHDYRDPSNPFFKFLNSIDGITFVVDPLVVGQHLKMAIIPHHKEQADFDLALKPHDVASADAFLVHQTFDGAIAETGTRLNGLAASPIELLRPRLGVYAGDVHMPQRQGIVTYVGCPYHVRFGDNFNPRCIFVDREGKNRNLYFDAPFKWSLHVQEAGELYKNGSLAEGDQVKLTVNLSREEMVHWKDIKNEILTACKELKLVVYGIKMEVTSNTAQRIVMEKGHDHGSTLKLFSKNEKLAKPIRETGFKLLEG